MIKLVIFDLNGTLTDDLGYHIESYYKVINKAGIDVSREEIKALLGKPCEEITKNLSEKHGKKLDVVGICKEKRDVFLELTKEGKKDVLIPGADFVLKELKKKGFLLGLFTGSGRENILLSMELFDTVIAGTELKEVKPNPAGLLQIMEKLQVKKEECVYVGDLPIDMETAKNAGVMGIGLESEMASKEELINAGAEIVINELRELLDVIR